MKRMSWTLLYEMNEMKVTKQICNTRINGFGEIRNH